jgi:hypothetical protein
VENFDRFTQYKFQGEAMSNFRIKVLGVAALATAFAGLSYGQTVVLTTATAASANLTLRAEGQTELVGDTTTIVTATNAAAITGVTVYATLTVPVTGKSQPVVAPSTFNSDVVLNVGGVSYYGTVGVSSNVVVFNGVSLPASGGGTADTIVIQNVRVNAVGAGNPSVSESILIQYPNPTAVSGSSNVTGGPAVAVGYILQSLSYAVAPAGASTFIPNFTACAGGTSLFNFATNPVTKNATSSFLLNVKELTAGAFRTQAQENGSFVPGVNPNNVGLSTQATQVAVTIANLPTLSTGQVTVYLPQTVTVNGTTLALAGSPTTVSSPIALPYVGYNPTAGTVTANYIVTIGAPTTATFPIDVYISFAGNTAPLQTTPISITAGYAPAQTITGPTTLIPTFAPNTATATNVETITACSTTLVFPYITNTSGFETGLAIANTSTDNLKPSATVAAGVSVATPTPGSCTMNFYGNTAQPAAKTFPPTGNLGAFSKTIDGQAPVYADTLTDLIGASNFSGYAIAQCNFQGAHGFAFITDLSGTFSGTMGYLAVVVPNGRGEGLGTGE